MGAVPLNSLNLKPIYTQMKALHWRGAGIRTLAGKTGQLLGKSEAGELGLIQRVGVACIVKLCV